MPHQDQQGTVRRSAGDRVRHGAAGGGRLLPAAGAGRDPAALQPRRQAAAHGQDPSARAVQKEGDAYPGRHACHLGVGAAAHHPRLHRPQPSHPAPGGSHHGSTAGPHRGARAEPDQRRLRPRPPAAARPAVLHLRLPGRLLRGAGGRAPDAPAAAVATAGASAATHSPAADGQPRAEAVIRPAPRVAARRRGHRRRHPAPGGVPRAALHPWQRPLTC
mmetsp:Transcript_21102/g.63479  ORF Transcript_21102/g.63479 Transcript_21102/m.63479 type:complete len:218 (+) Transcript_21102:5701-6354(+)